MGSNRDAGRRADVLGAAFRLAMGVVVEGEERDALPPELEAAAANYGSGKFRENADILVEKPQKIEEFIAYLRMESGLQLLLNNEINDRVFLNMARSGSVPDRLRYYYLGISHYRRGRVAKAMNFFSKARLLLEGQVVERGRFVEGSIRGVVSARSFGEFEEICRGDSAAQDIEPFSFVLDPVAPRSKYCHIIGCDEIYWEKYKHLFLTWAAPLSRYVDIWINCTNFSVTTINDIRRDAPFAFLSVDVNDFDNKKPYYTMTRFILAARLSREAHYERLTCSDMDMFVDAEQYLGFVEARPAGATGVYVRGTFPWRCSGAEFTIWVGEEGRKMLQWILAYYCAAYRPEIKGRNRQWWIDQYVLALLAEISEGSYPEWSLEPVRFNIVQRKMFPIKSPSLEKITKEQFIEKYAIAPAAA